jgi:uncharacterized SAM-binding protein YcdF (DUF218 family)
VTAVVNWAKDALRISTTPFLVVMLLIGVALLLVSPRWGRRWVVTLALALWVLSTPFGSGLLVGPLTRGFRPLEDQRDAAGAGAIVLLGGGMREASVGPIVLGNPSPETALRIVEAVRVFRLLDGKPLIVASGGLATPDKRVTEGHVIAAELAKLQVPGDRVLVEVTSKTTRDQAVIVTRLLASLGIRRFVLVTSPTHIWRSVLVFRAQGADVIASTAPSVSTRTAARRFFFVPNGESLQLSDDAVYDSASTLYYWANGWFRPAVPASTP